MEPTKYEVPTDLQEAINKLDDQQEDFNILEYTTQKKIKELEEAYVKALKAQQATQKKEVTKVGNMRVSRPERKDKEILSELKESGLKQSDYSNVVNKVKNTIEEIEKAADKIEQTQDFTYSLAEEDYKKATEFLSKTSITGITELGIDTNKFINSFGVYTMNTKAGPDKGLFIEVPQQLVLINKLSKLFNHHFLQKSDTQIKFTDLDRSICSFIKDKQISQTYAVSYALLKEMFKKMLICSLSTIEGAFRSTNNWMIVDFKNLIIKDTIMLQCLPDKLKVSFNKFVEELTKIKDAHIYSDIQKLDYTIHLAKDLELEQILAMSIKCMSPCIMYDYFTAIKSIYIFCGLYNTYIDMLKSNPKTQQEISNDVSLMIKCCNISYQNIFLYQNSAQRTIPYSKEKMSEELQLYYLNHVLSGPQFYLIKIFEHYVPALKLKI